MYNQNSDLMKQEKFMLPTMIEGDFSAEELAEDADGLQMSFQRVKIPAGGTLQFERRFLLCPIGFVSDFRTESDPAASSETIRTGTLEPSQRSK